MDRWMDAIIIIITTRQLLARQVRRGIIHTKIIFGLKDCNRVIIAGFKAWIIETTNQ